MAKNSLGREIPAQWRGRTLEPYLDPWSRKPEVLRATRPLVRRAPGDSKLLPSLRAAIEACGLKNGMTIRPIETMMNHATTEVFFDDPGNIIWFGIDVFDECFNQRFFLVGKSRWREGGIVQIPCPRLYPLDKLVDNIA